MSRVRYWLIVFISIPITVFAQGWTQVERNQEQLAEYTPLIQSPFVTILSFLFGIWGIGQLYFSGQGRQNSSLKTFLALAGIFLLIFISYTRFKFWMKS